MIGKLLLVLCLAFSCVQSDSIENGWHGIKALETTRDQVEKVLDAKPEKRGLTTSYYTQDAIVHVIYATKPCSNDGLGRFNIPENTVISYIVIPKSSKYEDDLAKMEIRLDEYERYDDEHQLSLVYYSNKEKGIRIAATKDGTKQILGTIDYDPPHNKLESLLCKTIKP